MTIKQLIATIEKIASKKPNINYVGVGNVYDLNTKPDVKYSVLYITPSKTDVYENEVTHSVTIFYIDRLTDNLDNKLEIQSNGTREITNIINHLVNTEDVEVNYPLSFTPFNQRFADDCAGVFTTITFSVEGEGLCFFE